MTLNEHELIRLFRALSARCIKRYLFNADMFVIARGHKVPKIQAY